MDVTIVVAGDIRHEVVAGGNLKVVGGTSEGNNDGLPCPLLVCCTVGDKHMPLLARRERRRD